MNRTQRHQIGMELFMAQISPYTSPMTGQTPEELLELACEQSRSGQHELCRKVQSGIRALLSNRYQVANLLPAQVRTFAESQFTPSTDQLLSIFQWLAGLHRSNQQLRVSWAYEIQGVAAQIGAGASDFLQSFSAAASQRVSLLQQPGCIALSLPDRLWGQAKLLMEDAVCQQPEQLPVFGYLFWVDATAE